MQTEPEKHSPTKPATPNSTPTNVFGYNERQPLDVILAPRNVAVIGATEKAGSVGRTILWNLISSPFGSTVFPVNANRSSILGIKAYPNLAALPEPCDLAVIVTPAASVPGIMGECVEAGIKGVIIISAGFKETGPAGAELERQVLEQARRGHIRLIGPNCLGVMKPLTGLNATFGSTIAKPGNVGFISQSGALCTAVLDWSLHENVGFSTFISVGSMLDVGWGDLIDHLGNDAHTKSIVIYMETVGDARSFLSAAREVALTKPIIVLKAGRTQAAAKAAASHTGSLTGSHEVFEMACRRSGVLCVDSIAELFYMAEVLGKQPRPRGPRLAIVTNAGGPGVLATDALIGAGGQLAELAAETVAALDQVLPAPWSHNNPIDILGDAGPERYAKAVEIAAKDPNSDGLLVILTPQAMTDPIHAAEQLQKYAKINKPVLASLMGGAAIAGGEAVLNQAGIPTFEYPDIAARMFEYMWRYTFNLNSLYETPMSTDVASLDRAEATNIIETARQNGRTILTEFESKRVLADYGIATVETQLAQSAAEAVEWAEKIGYPVVLKLNSETITHKTDVGGVQLNLSDAEAVRQAYHAIETSLRDKVGPAHFQGVTVQPMIKLEGYELILGSSLDAQFGPVLLFGSGGQLVEVYKDRALGLPPLTTTLARRIMERTRIFSALQGVRGREPVNLGELEQLMVRFSDLVVEQRWIKELDINPLLASPERLLALDARIVLHGPEVSQAQLPRLAIRPYPTKYIKKWTLKNGTPVTIRPIRPEDEPLMVKFHETLSERSVYYRWLHMLNLSQRVAHERLIKTCFIDYDREMALVADYQDPTTQEHSILGVGRLSRIHGTNEAEFAVLVSDQYQAQGLGTEFLRQLIEVGRAEQLDALVGEILPENRGMQQTSRKLGFKLNYSMEDRLMLARLEFPIPTPV